MEFLDNILQVIALVGIDAEGNQTVISICMPNEMKKTARVIFELWPSTEQIGKYEIALAAKKPSEALYTRQEIERMS